MSDNPNRYGAPPPESMRRIECPFLFIVLQLLTLFVMAWLIWILTDSASGQPLPAQANLAPDAAAAKAQAAKIKVLILALQAAQTNSPATTNQAAVVPIIPVPSTVATLCWKMAADEYRNVTWTNPTGAGGVTMTYPMTNQIWMRWLKSTNLSSGPFIPLPGAWPLDGHAHTLHDTNAISTNRTQYFYKAIAELPITPTITVSNAP